VNRDVKRTDAGDGEKGRKKVETTATVNSKPEAFPKRMWIRKEIKKECAKEQNKKDREGKKAHIDLVRVYPLRLIFRNFSILLPTILFDLFLNKGKTVVKRHTHMVL